jgi:hypothetical protein
MATTKQTESTTSVMAETIDSEAKQYKPVNLKPYYIYGRFPILWFMGTLGVGAYVASLLYDMFVK